MTSRDLLQQRSTLPNGDTVWRPTPLVTAALEGSLAVLDGVHRVNAGSFSVLHRSVLFDCGIAVAKVHEVSGLYSVAIKSGLRNSKRFQNYLPYITVCKPTIFGKNLIPGVRGQLIYRL